MNILIFCGKSKYISSFAPANLHTGIKFFSWNFFYDIRYWFYCEFEQAFNWTVGTISRIRTASIVAYIFAVSSKFQDDTTAISLITDPGLIKVQLLILIAGESWSTISWIKRFSQLWLWIWSSFVFREVLIFILSIEFVYVETFTAFIFSISFIDISVCIHWEIYTKLRIIYFNTIKFF